MISSLLIFLIAVSYLFIALASYGARPHRDAVARSRNPSSPVGSPPVFSFAVVLIFGYQLAFNFLPESVRLPMAGAVAALTIFLALLSTLGRRVTSDPSALYLLLGALLVSELIALFWVVHVNDLADFAGRFFPFFLATVLVHYPHLVSPALVVRMAVVTALVGSAIAFSGGVGFRGNIKRLAPFTGGADGTHSSAYVLVCCLIIIIEAALAGWLANRRALLMAGVIAAALVGLAVGTALVMALTYVVVRYWTHFKAAGPRLLTLLTLPVLAGFLVVQRINLHEDLLYAGHATGIDGFFSGRLTTWAQRLQLIAERSVIEQLLGQGVGSDAFESSVWRGAEKNSHQDYITIALENGWIGLILMVLIIVGIFRAAGPAMRAQGLAFAMASALSNGLIVRPMIACVFFVGLAASIQFNRGGSSPSEPAQIRSRVLKGTGLT